MDTGKCDGNHRDKRNYTGFFSGIRWGYVGIIEKSIGRPRTKHSRASVIQTALHVLIPTPSSDLSDLVFIRGFLRVALLQAYRQETQVRMLRDQRGAFCEKGRSINLQELGEEHTLRLRENAHSLRPHVNFLPSHKRVTDPLFRAAGMSKGVPR